MEQRDIQIIAQNANTATAHIVAQLLDPTWDVGDIMATYGPLHTAIMNHVLGEIASHTVQQGFPGSEVVQQPAQAIQMPPPGQYSAPEVLQQMQQPETGFVPQVVPDHQIMANAQPPQPVAPQGGGHKDDQLWQSWFSNPSDWYDNQFDKKNPKGPDFKSKSIPDPKNSQFKAGLWIKDAPPWAKAQLQAAGRLPQG